MNYRKRTERSVQLETLTSQEVRCLTEKDNNLAFIPLGSFEQHGPHAPLGTDTFISREISMRLARKLGGVVVPPISFGVSDEHMDFPGTITISPATLGNLLMDIIKSLISGGFNKIVILNGHGTNEQILVKIREKIEWDAGLKNTVIAISYWDRLPENERNKLSSLEWGLHANEFETSIITAIVPSMVKKLKDIKHFPDTSKLKGQEIDEKVFRQLIKDSNGVWGDPGQASIKKGRALLAVIELTLANYLIQIFKLSDSTSGRQLGN